MYLYFNIQCPDNCNNNGVCTEGRCSCLEGYSGETCSKQICKNNCNNNGICLDSGKCECKEGFFGDECSKIICPND